MKLQEPEEALCWGLILPLLVYEGVPWKPLSPTAPTRSVNEQEPLAKSCEIPSSSTPHLSGDERGI